MRLHARQPALALAPLLALLACGDGDSNTPADPTATPSADPSADPSATPSAAPGDPGAVVRAAGWGDNVTITLAADSFTFASDGLPDHDVLDAYALPNDGTTGVVETAHSVEIPLNPVVADAPTDTGLGTIGVAISGGVFFNPYEGDGTTIALQSNFEVDGAPFIDACNGHPLQDGGTYHYHGIPYCITDVVDAAGQHSALIGYALDGFPIYGPQDVDGEPPTDLDACSSHFGPTPEYPDGIRHYHLTEEAPYSLDCFVGEVDAAAGGGMGGPPGGGMGGPPPGRQ